MLNFNFYHYAHYNTIQAVLEGKKHNFLRLINILCIKRGL